MIPGKDGPPTLAWCLVPVSDVIVDHDSWNVSGLQGTGSKTVFVIDPVFVPKHRILPLGAVFSGKVPGLEIPDNDQARFGYPTFGPTALVAPIVGMAQGALDAFTETARGARRMARPGVFEKVAESPLIQSLIGEAAARIDAAHTLMVTSLREGQELVRAGGTLGHRAARADPPQPRLRGAHVVRGRQRRSTPSPARLLRTRRTACSGSGAMPTPRHCTPASTGTRCRRSTARSNWACSRKASSEAPMAGRGPGHFGLVRADQGVKSVMIEVHAGPASLRAKRSNPDPSKVWIASSLALLARTDNRLIHPKRTVNCEIP